MLFCLFAQEIPDIIELNFSSLDYLRAVQKNCPAIDRTVFLGRFRASNVDVYYCISFSCSVVHYAVVSFQEI